jgi:hypothetical protein
MIDVVAIIKSADRTTKEISVSGKMSISEFEKLLASSYGINGLKNVTFKDSVYDENRAALIPLETDRVNSGGGGGVNNISYLSRSQWNSIGDSLGKIYVSFHYIDIHMINMLYLSTSFFVCLLDLKETHMDKKDNANDKIIEHFKRSFSKSAVDFIPSEKFIVSRPGYVFTHGDKGLGYYLDKPKSQQPTLSVNMGIYNNYFDYFIKGLNKYNKYCTKKVISPAPL